MKDTKKKPFSGIPYLQGERILIKQITDRDADSLQEFVDSPRVYRYLPTFLFEKKYEDIHEGSPDCIPSVSGNP